MMGIITHHIMPPLLHLHPLRDDQKLPVRFVRLDISESPVGPAIEEKKEGP